MQHYVVLLHPNYDKLSALPQRLQDRDIVGHRRAAHVEHAGGAGARDLDVAGLAAHLHRRHHVHGDTGGADRVALGLQAAGRVDRQLAALGGPALGDCARALTARGQAHGLIL